MAHPHSHDLDPPSGSDSRSDSVVVGGAGGGVDVGIERHPIVESIGGSLGIPERAVVEERVGSTMEVVEGY